MNIAKIRCHRCKDILTDGELRTHFFKPIPLQKTPVCFHCSRRIIEETKRKYLKSQILKSKIS